MAILFSLKDVTRSAIITVFFIVKADVNSKAKEVS